MSDNSEKKKVFMSYAREDIETAGKLYGDLKQAGVSLWMDKFDLLPGQIWKTEVKKAIEKASFFITLISDNSVSKEKGFFHKEQKIALDLLDEMPENRIFIIPVRIDKITPENERLMGKIKDIHWADLFKDYDEGLKVILDALVHEDKSILLGDVYMHRSELGLWLRNKPDSLSDKHVHLMLNKYGFFSKKYKWTTWYNESKLFKNEFLVNENGTVTDLATGLMWQKSGSTDCLYNKKAQKYINELNRERFAGYDDWRLPTIEELSSLIENRQMNENLYIHPIFDNRQQWCWSSDKRAVYSYLTLESWQAYFNYGNVYNVFKLPAFVRAVRSEIENIVSE
ncbi:MAG: TIR domain-containing protein [Desulfobacteraceae bacterium]|nr:TIR domain-containing protein [Desulfobacteraceae bacterium]